MYLEYQCTYILRHPSIIYQLLAEVSHLSQSGYVHMYTTQPNFAENFSRRFVDVKHSFLQERCSTVSRRRCLIQRVCRSFQGISNIRKLNGGPRFRLDAGIYVFRSRRRNFIAFNFCCSIILFFFFFFSFPTR